MSARCGNIKKAVVVRVLNAESGKYYCVYQQSSHKNVVADFIYVNGKWKLTDNSGRVIKDSEWSQYVSN